MTIWFTSDTHFLHENIVDYSSRPFLDVNHMTEGLIEKWNERVKNGDTVYHLGDFALTNNKKQATAVDLLLRRLNGQKFLIKGNHDRDAVTGSRHWVKVADYMEIKVDIGEVHKQRIVMSHYPFRSWNQMHRGAIMLHGHCHGNLTHTGGKIMDIGVDVHEYAPISLDAVLIFMRDQSVVSCDHHTPGSDR